MVLKNSFPLDLSIQMGKIQLFSNWPYVRQNNVFSALMLGLIFKKLMEGKRSSHKINHLVHALWFYSSYSATIYTSETEPNLFNVSFLRNEWRAKAALVRLTIQPMHFDSTRVTSPLWDIRVELYRIFKVWL